MLKIFVNTWGNYNERGAEGGRWLELPMDEDELQETLDEIAEAMEDDDPEWFVNDYEWEIDVARAIDENERIEDLNEEAEELDSLDDDEFFIVAALMNEGYGMEEAIEAKDDCTIWSDCEDMEDVARAYCDECGILDSIPENLRYYFDYAAFGRDMDLEGHFVFLENGDCLEIH